MQVTTRDNKTLRDSQNKVTARCMMAGQGQLGFNKKELRGSTERERAREACLEMPDQDQEPQHIAAQLILAHTHVARQNTKCLVPVNRGKISRCGDIIAVIESQHGTNPCVLQTLPNDPA